jgi:hypothetical protein
MAPAASAALPFNTCGALTQHAQLLLQPQHLLAQPMDLVGPSILVRNLTRLGTLRPFERAIAFLQCRCSILLRRPQRAAQLAYDRWLLLRWLQLAAERKQAIGLTGSSVLPSQQRTQSPAGEPLARLTQRSRRCGNLLISQFAIHRRSLSPNDSKGYMLPFGLA